MWAIVVIVGILWIYGSTVDPATPHFMTPTTVGVTLLLALMIDFSSFGPNSLRDRIAFVLATPAIREGFDGSPADQWTVQWLRRGIESLLDSPPVSGSYLAGASANVLIGVVISVLWLYVVLCMLPAKPLTKRLGRAAAITFPASAQWRLNLPLWACAIALGLMADLPAGMVGSVCRASIDVLIAPITGLVVWLFGGA